MTKYIQNKLCAEPETRIVTYCVDHNLEFNRVTAKKNRFRGLQRQTHHKN